MTIKYILQKEFLQIFRSKAMIPIIFLMPLFQLLILANAATYEIKNISFCVVDYDYSNNSREFVSKFYATNYFLLSGYYTSVKEAEEELKTNKSRLIIHIPKDFEKDLLLNKNTKVQFLINAENANAAGLIMNYSMSIVQAFNKQIITETVNYNTSNLQSGIYITYSNWFNNLLNYKTYMVPGILVALVTLIGLFLSGMNIVKEKETGTIEQINVSPIKKYQFIIGKLLPFWIIALIELAFGIILGIIIFNVPLIGNPLLIFLVASVYLLLILGIGLFISTITETQQQAMFIAWFIMIIFLLLGGIFTPVENMPDWAQTIDIFNPIAHFSKMIRMIMLKGSGLRDIGESLMLIGLYAIVMLFLATIRYRKKT